MPLVAILVAAVAMGAIALAMIEGVEAARQRRGGERLAAAGRK